MSSSLQKLNNNLWILIILFLVSFFIGFIGMRFFYENYYSSSITIMINTTVEKQYIYFSIDDIFSNKSPDELLAIETKRLNELSNSTLCIPKLDFYDGNHIAQYSPNEIKINNARDAWNNSLMLTIILRHELMHHYFYHKCKTEEIYINNNNKKSSLEESVADVYVGALPHSKKTCNKFPEHCIFNGVKDKNKFMDCVFQNCEKDKFLSLNDGLECY